MKILEKLEVPLYLLIIGLYVLEKGNTELALFIFIVSFFRLWVNSIKDGENKSNSEGDL
tara:strand:+ start:113 stop:289 length:177 start_codon:yes stop_codon:yes gene_type:complete